MKLHVSIAAMASAILLLSMPAAADYYEYRDELRKPGQTIEEAMAEQEQDYRDRMREKYSADTNMIRPLTNEEKIQIRKQHLKLERRAIADRLDLTDEQKSQLEEMHGESETFYKSKRSEIREFQIQKQEEFRKMLTPEQQEKMKKLRLFNDHDDATRKQ